MGQIACVQSKSTLEHKVKRKALKGIFLVCKWINNTFLQVKFCAIPLVSSKKSLLFV